MNFRSLTATALVIGLLAGAGVYAQGRRGLGPGGRGPGLAMGALNLTDAQRQQIRDIREQHQSEMRSAQDQLRTAQMAQRKAIEAVPTDEGAIRATSQDLADAQTAVALVQARVHNETWNVLTSEQQDQARKLQAAREARMEQQRQRREQRRR